MQIKWIYKIIPVLIIFSDRLLPKRFSAYSYVLAVVVRPKAVDRDVLVRHELVHCRQFYRTLGLHSILYYTSKKYRLKAELEAYKIQMKAGGWNAETTHRIIGYLTKNYNLDMSREEIEDAVYLYYWE